MVPASQRNPRGAEADGRAPMCPRFMKAQSKLKVLSEDVNAFFHNTISCQQIPVHSNQNFPTHQRASNEFDFKMVSETLDDLEGHGTWEIRLINRLRHLVADDHRW